METDNNITYDEKVESQGIIMENLYLFDKEEKEHLLKRIFGKKDKIVPKILSIGAIHVLDIKRLLTNKILKGEIVTLIGDTQTIQFKCAQESKIYYGPDYDTVHLTNEAIQEIVDKLKMTEGYIKLDSFQELTIKITKTVIKNLDITKKIG